MKLKKRTKNILKIFILIILIIGLIFLTGLIYQEIQKNKFQKILKENDASNYELVENINGEEIKVYVRDKVLLSEDGNTKIWLSEFEQKRVIFDDEYKTAIFDENDEELKVNSLNYTYINDFFENSNQSFKYIGKDKGYYKIQFKEKESDKITLLYINQKTNMVDKVVQNAGKFELVTEFKVNKDCVSKDKVAYPNLEGYRVSDSVSSNPTE